MAIKQANTGAPGGERGMGVSVGGQAGHAKQEGRNEGHLGRRARPDYGVEPHHAGDDAASGVVGAKPDAAESQTRSETGDRK